MGQLPRLVLTGAAGFLGKQVIERLAGKWRIEAVDRDPPIAGPLAHRPDVAWHAVDLTDAAAVTWLFTRLRADGGAAALVHLAAHYDFTGERHPDYQRTNVDGTRRLLDACDGLGLERFVFASSLAACEFPRAGKILVESSPPDGAHIYAESKRAGEAIVRGERRFPTTIVRFAALYSDWCEYAPLFSLLRTWLSKGWNSRILGGRGRSAVPYLHVRDAGAFLERLLDLRRELEPAEVLIASPNRVTSHADLFRAVTAYVRGRPLRPIFTPQPIATLGLRFLDLVGKASGDRPFERPWMAKMIDRRLEVDPSHTYERLGWTPRARLEVTRRIPFLIENQYSEQGTWAARNEAALHIAELPAQVQILRLFEAHEEELFEAATRALVADPVHFPHYATVGSSEHDWNHRQFLRNLAQSVRTRHRGFFRTYCHDLALRRARQGIPHHELDAALLSFQRVFYEVLAADPRAAALQPHLHELVTRTIEFGLDGVEAGYEEAGPPQATTEHQPPDS